MVLWPLDLSITTRAFFDGASVSSHTFLMYGKIIFPKKQQQVLPKDWGSGKYLEICTVAVCLSLIKDLHWQKGAYLSLVP